MNWALRRCVVVTLVYCSALMSALMVTAKQSAFAAPPKTLHLDIFTGNEASWGVTSTLIYGKTESILIDSQFRISQAKQLADRVAATKTHLEAIIITHPDDDHYIGTAVLHERFPDTPIYMTARALEEFNSTSAKWLAGKKKSDPTETPDSLPTLQVLPTTIFTVDGETVEVIEDFQGDVLKTMNSFIWIPSLRAVIAGDVVFNEVHPWLGDSTTETRRAWHDSLQLIATLQPRVVVGGHKKNASVPDSPQAVTAMEKYLDDFELAKKAASNADELMAAMKQKYPGWAEDKLFLVYSVNAAFPNATP